MAHSQALIDQAQAYADAFYAYFPYGAIFVYGHFDGSPFAPHYGVCSYMEPMNFPFWAGFDETNGMGEYGPVNAKVVLVEHLLKSAAMYHDPSYEAPFGLNEPSIQMVSTLYATRGITQPTAILRGGGPHLLLVP